MAHEFYKEHQDKPFFDDLVEFMCSGPIIVQVLEKEQAIQANRDLMGHTNPQKAAEHSIRSKYGSNIERNAVHGSDSTDSAKREIYFFFSEMELLLAEEK